MCQTSSSDASPGSSVCGPGKFTTNLKSHLKSSHSSSYKELVKQEERTKDEEKAKTVRRHVGPAKQKKKKKSCATDDKISNQWQEITRKMDIFIASSSVPNSIVENAEFRLLIEARYQTPSPSKMSKEMDFLMDDLKGKIKVYPDSFCMCRYLDNVWHDQFVSWRNCTFFFVDTINDVTL